MKAKHLTPYDKVDQYIDGHKEENFKLLQRLVQQKSTQGNEGSAQKIIIEYLRTLPVSLDIWELSPSNLQKSPFFISDRIDFSGSPNVVAVLEGSGGGRSILLNGHIDVVPEGEREKWTDDPYSGIIRNGKLYGRGSSDMKGGTLALIMAIAAITNNAIRLKGDVIFESVIEEESGGAGTLAAALRGYKADGAIIPEPTGMKMFVKQQGSMWFRIAVKGKSAHGGTRYEGISAIEKALVIHDAILDLEKKRNADIVDPLFNDVPIPLPINIGTISGGTWPSSVPDLVTIEGRMGVGPEEKIADARNALATTVADTCQKDDWLKSNPAKLEFFGAQWVPNSVQSDHALVKTVGEHYAHFYHSAMKIEASPWGTDAGVLNAVNGTQTLVIGPGETRLAHYPDEHIDLGEVTRAAKIFSRTIIDWCGLIDNP